MLEGDQEEVTYIDAEGVIRSSVHHDDWAGVDWYNEDGVDRGHRVVYRDVTRATPVPNVLWLLMKLVFYEVQRRRWVCPLTPNFVNLQLMHVCNKIEYACVGVF